MRKSGCAALFAACLIATSVASAGDFFVNGQAGRIELDSGFGSAKTNLVQASAGYRWGIGMAQLGLEAGFGKPGDQRGQARTDFAGGHVAHDYTLSSRYGFLGANARIKPPLMPVYFIGRAGFLGLQRTLDETATFHSLASAPVTERREFKEHDGGTYVGAGVGTTILPLLDIGLMLGQYRHAPIEYDPSDDEFRLSDRKRDTRSVSLSVEYRF